MTNTALTDRQREILIAYLTEGTIPRAAEKVGIHERTVDAALKAVRRKLGVEESYELLTAARDAGIVRFEVV